MDIAISPGKLNLTSIPNLNTSKVQYMSRMFYECDKIIEIPNFDTSNVKDMSCTFENCFNLKTIPNFNINNVTNMLFAFQYDNNLSRASINNIVSMCINATKVSNKNWNHIGLNTTNNIYTYYNDWIRSAPDYSNAIAAGWQNIGDPITLTASNYAESLAAQYYQGEYGGDAYFAAEQEISPNVWSVRASYNAAVQAWMQVNITSGEVTE